MPSEEHTARLAHKVGEAISGLLLIGGLFATGWYFSSAFAHAANPAVHMEPSQISIIVGVPLFFAGIGLLGAVQKWRES